MEKENIGYLIKRIDNRMRQDYDVNLKQHDLTFSQVQVLFYIHHNGGSVTQKELESFLKVSHPTVVGLVQRLEAHDYVTCSVDPNDKRNKIITLTDEAVELEEDLKNNRKQSISKLLAGMNNQEVDELIRLLSKVYENIEQREEEPHD